MKKNSFKNENESEEEQEEISIKVHQNNIYLYSGINHNLALEFNIEFKKLEEKMLNISSTHSCPPPEIIIHINSEGGELYAALSIVGTICDSKVPTKSIIEGWAASAATLISIVCDHRIIRKHSHMLIHQLSGGLTGKYNECKDELQQQSQLMKVMIDIYTEYTDINKNKLRNTLKKDILLSSDTCLKYGLVDEIN